MRLRRTMIVMASLALVLVGGCTSTHRWTLDTHGYSSNFSVQLLRLNNYLRTIYHNGEDTSTEAGRWRSIKTFDVETEEERVVLVLEPHGSQYRFLLFMNDGASRRFERRIKELNTHQRLGVSYSSRVFTMKLLDGPKNESNVQVVGGSG